MCLGFDRGECYETRTGEIATCEPGLRNNSSCARAAFPASSLVKHSSSRRKSPTKNLRFGTRRFSRRWLCPAGKSRTPIFSADSIGILRNLQPSMPYVLEAREDPKLGLAAEMLRCRGTVRLELRGTSMLPSLWPGDLLTIQCVAYDEVVPGDIVLVMRDNRFFVHRLVETRRGQDCFSLITRGDAVPHNDPPLAPSELLGQVTGVRRADRSFVPDRRLSPLQSALAWMVSRGDRFRNLALRIHEARLQAGPPRARQAFRRVFGAVRGIPGISPSRTSYP